MLASYRSRLIALMLLFTGLMLVVLMVSYFTARWVIWEDADLHLQRTVQLYERNLAGERIALARYAAGIRNDGRIQDYAFAVIRIGAPGDSFHGLIRDHIARMPVSAAFIAWKDGIVMDGEDAAALADEVRRRPAALSSTTFYVETGDELFMVAVLPLRYQDEVIGQLAVARNVGREWILDQARGSQIELFTERNGVVTRSTNPEFTGVSLDLATGKIRAGGETYRVAEITLPAGKGVDTRFWLAQSDTALVETLDRYNRIMSGLALLLLAVMLVTGVFAVNGFSRPMQKLIALTRDIADGQLPDIRRARGDTEADQLLNQFIELVEALRTKQQEVEDAHRKLKISAITDELTGLYNRRYLNEIYPKIVAQAEREGLCISLLLMDIDHFKQINDSYGHLAGDACLADFAALLKRSCRKADFVFRMGGEEFLVLALGQGGSTIDTLAEKIRIGTENLDVEFHGRRIGFTVSCGITCFRGSATCQPTLSHLVSLADAALYQAKEEGRNCIRVNNESCTRTAEQEAAGRICCGN